MCGRDCGPAPQSSMIYTRTDAAATCALPISNNKPFQRCLSPNKQKFCHNSSPHGQSQTHHRHDHRAPHLRRSLVDILRAKVREAEGCWCQRVTAPHVPGVMRSRGLISPLDETAFTPSNTTCTRTHMHAYTLALVRPIHNVSILSIHPHAIHCMQKVPAEQKTMALSVVGVLLDRWVAALRNGHLLSHHSLTLAPTHSHPLSHSPNPPIARVLSRALNPRHPHLSQGRAIDLRGR